MTEVLSAQKSASGTTGVEPRPLVGSRRSKSPLSPQLKIDPASEWANSTLSALDTTEEVQSSTTPGPALPGAYPYTPSSLEPGPSFEEVKDTAREYLYAAGQYVPSHEDIKKMAQNAGSTVRGYIPNGVATYLGEFIRNLRFQLRSKLPFRSSASSPRIRGCLAYRRE
ncbi:hypothetical protein P691DRAFT_215498 [Macrolepiota fuliginosa MF-IS2]|uniref:Uncharacterized protein n=1 Tax=Macrolepiota fuliginosa MF-IS2 TaxID=1400762 RepID=A0A9P5X7Y4_9AGAR|nr:hypothetical protein P691DRAFT_215498 [Macrolepiota fuliginosa MF-IS2]